jgi:hypothetical protein
MVSVDEGVHFKHVKVIRSDIGLESVEQHRDVHNGPISQKKPRYPLGPILKHRNVFLRIKTLFSRYSL